MMYCSYGIGSDELTGDEALREDKWSAAGRGLLEASKRLEGDSQAITMRANQRSCLAWHMVPDF